MLEYCNKNRGIRMKWSFKNILFLILIFISQLYGFDNNGQPNDGNDNCPGETINLSPTGPSPFTGNGNVREDSGDDWVDRFKFTVPQSGQVTVTLVSTNYTDLDFKMSAQRCGQQDLARKDDSYSDTKTFTFNAVANHTYYLAIFDNDWIHRSNPYTLTIDYPTNSGGGSCENYDSNNDGCPGRIITSMDQITSSKSTCITGISRNNEGRHKKDYYRFQVQTNGTLRIRGTSPNNHKYHLRVGSSCGGTQYYGDTRSKNHDTGDITLHAGDTIYIRAKETGNDDDQYKLNLSFKADDSGTPPVMNSVDDLTVESGDSVSRDFSSYVTKTDGDDITEYQLGGSLPSGLSFDSSTGVLSGSTTSIGDYDLTIKAKDKDGWSNTKSWTLHVIQKSNTPPIMNSIPDQKLQIDKTFNFSLSNYVTKTNNDQILQYHLSGSLPDGLNFNKNSGQITGKVTNTNLIGQTFTLTAWVTDKDGDSNKQSFKIRITAKDTDITEGDKDFKIVNSMDSRFIRGNYLITGNTIMCNTDNKNHLFTLKPIPFFKDYYKPNSYCSDITKSNQGRINNYIDIDNNPNTWNSSSANFTLPQNARILWAGLFWQGNLNNRGNYIAPDGYVMQRRAVPNDKNNLLSGWHWVYNDGNYGDEFKVQDSTANLILIKIDGESSYHQIKADTLAANNIYYHETIGGPYGAFADITSLVKQKNIHPGKHKITIANLSATNGQDGDWLGNWGGWCVVVVYESKDESIKNISIYNGFTNVFYKKGVSHKKEITISGFKLPNYHDVKGYMSIFSGDGEIGNTGDFISLDNKGMPGVSDPYNVLDGVSKNLDRDSTPSYNNLTNMNTIDIDHYDVGKIMTELRDRNKDAHEVKIQLETKKMPNGGHDAFFPSMIAFATDLYVPKVCYDYDLKVGKYYDLPSDERKFNATAMGNEPLTTKIMLKSEEADFDLVDAKMKLKFTPGNVFGYIPTIAQTTYPNTYEYHKAIEIDPNEGEIAVGANATTEGGTIAPLDFLYSKLYYKFNKASFNGKFDIYLDAKVSFDGVHKIPYTLSTDEPADSIFNIPRCAVNPVYDPVYGMFNIERGDSDFGQTEADRYSLYTQVVGVPYEVSIAAYKKDSNGEYKSKGKATATVELELIDASTFENNSSSGFDSICRDPDTYSMGKFVRFNNKSRVKVKIPNDFPIVNGQKTYPENLALKNAAFRVWVLTKKVGNNNVIVNHNCSSQAASSCFDNVYAQNYASTNKCSSECTNSTGTTCYDCLRRHFAIPSCSRDNFAIRPESYHIALSDNNQTYSNKNILIAQNRSNTAANLAAGYLYHLDINATKFNDTINRAVGYYLNVVGDKTTKKAQSLFNDSSNCNDRANYDLSVYMYDGKTLGFETLAENKNTPKNGMLLNNSGKYKLHIEDNEWTKVDQKNYPYKPFRNHADCIDKSTSINSDMKGCSIQSNLSNNYYDLNVNMHPYRFKLVSIRSSSAPNGSHNYVYINDLSSTTNLIKNNRDMAIKVTGDVVALGRNGKTLSNYINGCSANDLTLSLGFNTIPSDVKDSTGNSLTLNYALYDRNADGNNVVVNSSSSNIGSVNLNFKKRYFYTPSKGSLNSYFNFKREYNNPINPFKLHFGTLNAKSINEKITVDLQKNYIPSGSKNINNTKTLYYAKLKSEADIYDDIYKDRVKTPLYVAIFCDKSLSYCANYGIDTTKSLTNEYNWWLSLNHDGNNEGEAILKTNPSNKASINPSTINNFTDGVAKDVTVISNDRNNLPYLVLIEPDTQMINRFPWLLYNSYQDNPPAYIYKVRFVKQPPGWSGHGKTGHTINVTNSGRRTKKVDW